MQSSDDDLFVSQPNTSTQDQYKLELTPGNSGTFSPYTQKNNLKTGIMDDLKIGDEDSEEESEEESDGLEEIERLEGKKRDLIKKVTNMKVELDEAVENRFTREQRVEDKKMHLDKQQATLYKQKMKIDEDDSKDNDIGAALAMVDGEVEEIKKKMKELDQNTARLTKGKEGAGKESNTKINTLYKLKKTGKNITVFYTGSEAMDRQPQIMKEDMMKINNLKLVECGKEGVMKIGPEIKKCEVNKKEDEVGVVLVSWNELSTAMDTDMLTIEIDDLVDILDLVVKRGEEKFGKFAIVLPAAVGQNEKELEELSTDIKNKYEPGTSVISLTGKLNSPRENQTDQDEMKRSSSYILRHCLSEVALYVGGEEGEVCRKCGFLEHEAACLVVEDEENTGIDY